MTAQRKDRAEWIQKRVEEAYAAAEANEGWTQLGKLWGCSNACALQWCKTRVPAEICARIGQNGKRHRKPHLGRKFVPSGRPVIVFRSLTPKPVYDTCVYVKYEIGVGRFECGQPSHGHPHCPDCMKQQQVAPVGSRYVNGGSQVYGIATRRASAA